MDQTIKLIDLMSIVLFKVSRVMRVLIIVVKNIIQLNIGVVPFDVIFIDSSSLNNVLWHESDVKDDGLS